MKKLILSLFILYLPFQLRLPQVPLINTINLFLILFFFIFAFGKSRMGGRSKFDTPLVLFLLIWIASYVHTLTYPAGIGLWRYEITVLFKRLISLVLVYYVFASCIKTKKEWNFLFSVFLLSVVLVGLHTWHNGMLAGPNFADFKRSSGPFAEDWQGSDIAGGFLATFTPFLLAFSLFTRQKIRKVLGFIGTGICIFGIMATYSRGSIIALVLVIIVTILISAKLLIKTSKLPVLIMLLIFIGLMIGWQRWVPASIVNRIKGTVKEQAYDYESSLDSSSEQRIVKWNMGIEIFKNNLVFGVGFKIPEYILATDTHNTFIQIAAEIGILGIFFFIWFLWSVLCESIFVLKTEYKAIGVGFIGCIVAFVFVNMFYSNFFRDTVVGTLWIVLGLLASSRKIALAENKK